MCKRDILLAMETDKDFVNVDDNFFDPQFCATIACDIYKHLRASEVKDLMTNKLFFSIFFCEVWGI